MTSAYRIAIFVILGWCAVSSAVAADDARESGAGGMQLPEGLQIEWRGTLTQAEDGTAMFSGPVTIWWKDSRIQGDVLRLRDRRYIEAEGNVLLVWGRSRIFGQRLTYDLETERGVIENAMGQTLDEYLFWAKRVEKIGADRIHLESATITTCTQPVPYWSFSVSSATIRIDSYARMWNVRLRAARAPLIYLPYLVWPVKQDRAPGLMIPELHTSQTRGQMWRQELFIPLGRSADLTLEGRYYTEQVLGGGGELQVIPNPNGSIDLQGFYINDEIYARQRGGDPNRYQVTYREEQRFLNGFRMVADVDAISDPEYLGDYKRDLNVASTPQTLARLEFSRNGPWVSLNVRELRREQLSSGLVQQTLPEVELRGRSRRLWKTPLYLDFEASAASIQQREDISPGEPPFEPDYLRGDLSPTISLPFSPVSWLDITPQVNQRLTYYTQRQQTIDSDRRVDDQDLTRALTTYGLEIVGPKISRIFRPAAADQSRFRHSLEPRIRYGFAEAFDRTDEILLYDEVDRVNGAGEQINYALVQRLFAKRPRAAQELESSPAQSMHLPDGTILEPSPGGVDPGGPPASGPEFGEPVEIARLEISQTHSFEEQISRADVDGDGTLETSPYSPVLLSGRYSPGRSLSLDLRSQYDILFDQIRNASLSGTLQGQLARMRFSVVHNQGLGVDALTGEGIESSTQVRATSGLSLAGGKVQLNLDGSYTANPVEGTSHFPDQRWQFQYATQCCTFLAERLTRDFATTEDRRELYFRVDLRGIGKILSSTF